ncbi:hypothetical protein [Frankia sp. CiP3]|uniref:hypothetical protein n=1 Tax=Frankia sp. CiP3 TaxID=2880971 RepID=UPI001EF52368|nr:hypothetical protein [Frankia sp. CiP3]
MSAIDVTGGIDPDLLAEAFALSRAASEIAHAACDLLTPARTDDHLLIAETVLHVAVTVGNLATTMITTRCRAREGAPDPAAFTLPLEEEPF